MKMKPLKTITVAGISCAPSAGDRSGNRPDRSGSRRVQKKHHSGHYYQHPGHRPAGRPDSDVSKENRLFCQTIAVGSGQAMAMDRRRSGCPPGPFPDAEVKFMAGQYGINRRLVMHNDFVIVGPPADPAHIKGSKTSPEAFKKIAGSGSLFMSRGDNSEPMRRKKHLESRQPQSGRPEMVSADRTGHGQTSMLPRRKRAIPLPTGNMAFLQKISVSRSLWKATPSC